MTDSNIHNAGNATIYPGLYEPLPADGKESPCELDKKSTKVVAPRVYVNRMHDYYRIELSVPGFRKEDLLVQTNGRVLSIEAMDKGMVSIVEPHSRPRYFNYRHIKRDIVLPKDADTAFVTAEYNNGILCICLSKTNCRGETWPGRIVVY